jgi:hypothetical protein
MPAPTPITAAGVPATVNANIPVALRVGIAYAYNAAVAAEYAALDATAQAAYVPPTVGAYVASRMADVFSSYTSQAYEADLQQTQVHAKWASLTQAQRDAIKTALASVP